MNYRWIKFFHYLYFISDIIASSKYILHNYAWYSENKKHEISHSPSTLPSPNHKNTIIDTHTFGLPKRRFSLYLAIKRGFVLLLCKLFNFVAKDPNSPLLSSVFFTYHSFEGIRTSKNRLTLFNYPTARTIFSSTKPSD